MGLFDAIWSSLNDTVGWGFQAYDNYQENRNFAQNVALSNRQLDLAEKEYYSNLDIMNKNFGLQQEAFNYNKAQADLTRQREDNAFQRRVQDYVNSGFSPLAAQGVASSSPSPTLTAPQLDPSGVNQATVNRLTAYQNKIASNNQTAQLKLQQQQLRLAQLETVKEMASSIFSIRGQILNNDKLKVETDWYKIHGFRDQTFQTLISDFINGFGDSFGGNTRDLGKWSGDKLQDGWNKMLKGALGLGLGNKNSSSSSSGSVPPLIQATNSRGEHITEKTFYNTVSDIEKLFQKGNIEKIDVKKLKKLADNIGWKGVSYTLPDNATKLSSNTYQQLRQSFNKYLEEFNKLSPEFKSTMIDNLIKAWNRF